LENQEILWANDAIGDLIKDLKHFVAKADRNVRYALACRDSLMVPSELISSHDKLKHIGHCADICETIAH
jgi:hypothetical protein